MTVQRCARIAALCAIWLIVGSAFVRAEEGPLSPEKPGQTRRSTSSSSRRALILQARASASRPSDTEAEAPGSNLAADAWCDAVGLFCIIARPDLFLLGDVVALFEEDEAAPPLDPEDPDSMVAATINSELSWAAIFALSEICRPAKPVLGAAETALMLLRAESVNDVLVWNTGVYTICTVPGVWEAVSVAERVAAPLDLCEPTLPLDPDFPDEMVVATVNSESITAEDALEWYRFDFGTHAPMRGNADERAEKRRNDRRKFVRTGLQDVVERKLKVIGFKATLDREQLDSLETDLEKRWEEVTLEVRRRMNVTTSELEQKMRDRGNNVDLIKQILLERFLADRFDSELESKAEEPTSREVHHYYEQNMEKWAYSAGVKWQEISILCGFDERPAEAEARARGLLAKLQAGADFSELAREHSEGITKAKGGFRDWTPAGAFGCQEDEDFLFSARIGEISKVIRGRDEFHIVRLLLRREAGHRRFEDVEAKIRATLKYRAFCRLRHETMRKLLNEAEIVTVFGDGWEFSLPAVGPRSPE